MANGKRGTPDAKRRRPTTLDLKATEVASEPVKPAESVEIKQEIPGTPEPEPAMAAKSEASSEPPPGPKAGQPEWLDSAALGARFAALREIAAERMDWRLAGAGATGATVMFVLFLIVWAFGAFTPRDTAGPLAARLAPLETQMRELANRPQPVADPRPLADLAARVAAAEQTMARLADIEARLAKSEAAAAAPRPAQVDQALTARVVALEAALRPLAELAPRIEAAGSAARDANTAARDAKSRADAAHDIAQKNAAAPAADRQEIEALTARIATLEQVAKSAEARIAATAGADRAGRLAFVAVSLRAAAERGDPLATDIAAVRPLVSDAKTLAPLEPFAATGVPRAPALARELSQLTGAMLAAAGTAPRDGGFIDRLQQNAERLVRIRPVNEAPGDDLATIIARADIKATQGDLAAARAELMSLPAAVRAPAQGWIDRTQARDAALAAARDLATNAVAALSKPGR